MKAKFAIIIFLSITLFLLFPFPVNAVSITLFDIPSSVSQDEFSLSVSVSGAQAGTNYLRIDIFKEDTSNYFGETYNGNSWYGGSDAIQYYPINIQSGVDWSGSVKGRIGSPSQTEYDGTGNYKLKIRRYTSSGNYNSTESNNSAVIISIVFPTQTPIPTPTPTPSNTPTPVKIPTPTKTPTLAKTPTPIKTPTPTKAPTAASYIQNTSSTISSNPTSKPTGSLILNTDIKDSSQSSVPVLAISTESAVSTDYPQAKISKHPEKENSLFLFTVQKNTPVIFFSAGAVIIIICAILLYKKYGKSQNSDEEL